MKSRVKVSTMATGQRSQRTLESTLIDSPHNTFTGKLMQLSSTTWELNPNHPVQSPRTIS